MGVAVRSTSGIVGGGKSPKSGGVVGAGVGGASGVGVSGSAGPPGVPSSLLSVGESLLPDEQAVSITVRRQAANGV